MIAAELSHNPYLLETKVKFNGQAPRVNCQIEKYEKMPFKEWYEKVPSIFHDEMNGYDFELNFTGTTSDFKKLQKAFSEVGVSDAEVHLLHKRKIEKADTKRRKVDELLEWICENSRNFDDVEKFKSNYAGFFGSKFSYKVIHGNPPADSLFGVDIEAISCARELYSVNLVNTPVLICVTKENEESVKEDIDTLMTRNDIRQGQLFFWIHPLMDKERMKRIITDLGVNSPQIVDDYADEIIKDYIKDFPETAYVREAIAAFRKLYIEVNNKLEKKNKQIADNEASINVHIRKIEDKLNNKNSAIDKLSQIHIDRTKIYEIKNKPIEMIENWKKKKVRIENKANIDKAAVEYDEMIQRIYSDFCKEIRELYDRIADSVSKQVVQIYDGVDGTSSFVPEKARSIRNKELNFDKLESLKSLFSESTYEETEEPWPFFKNKEIDMVLVEKCNLSDWRNKASERFSETANNNIKVIIARLVRYLDVLKADYQTQLRKEIEIDNNKKNMDILRCSNAFIKLNQDKEWIIAFNKKLCNIERG